ncbi:MAG: AmmeMemoRadiSam system protein B [Chlamydiae bacterium]|nr:AmmeMemoRadiSam system protein B [Chlamydiota bacterium]MBI3266698.1 AmmeMemoRadiSam system protein B [Chlamydiota bacterium]
MKNIREPIAAGTLYPSSPDKLRSDVLGLLGDFPASPLSGEWVAMVVPHAAYAYSGTVAAYNYRILRECLFDTVIILGPNHHRLGFRGTSIYARGAFKTPLGEMYIDEILAEEILSRDTGAVFDEEAHLREHSIEVQIPFLQVVSPQIKIVPISMADYHWKTCGRLAQAIVKGIKKSSGKKILIMASTDLSHYHPYERACQMDQIAIQDIESMDPGRLHMDAEHGMRCELCGFGPVLTTMLAARDLGAHMATTLFYRNSGDVTGEKDRVVGYASIVVLKEKLEGEEVLKEMEQEFWSEKEKKVLL